MSTDATAALPLIPTHRARRRARASSAAPLWQLLKYIRPHRRYALLTAVFGVFGFLLSFVYPALIGSAVDLVSRSGRGGAPSAEDRATLLSLAGMALVTALAQGVVVYGRGHYNVHLSHGIVADLRRAVFNHLQQLSVRFYTKERTGGILSRIVHDVHDATSLIYSGIIVAALDCIQLVIAILLLGSISWKLTLACVAMFPLYALVFVIRNPRVRLASERLRLKFCEILGNVAEVLAGQALVKAYTAETREASRFAKDVGEHHGLVVAQSHEGHLVAALGDVLVNLGTTIVVGYGGWLALRGELTAGMLTRFLGYVIIMYGPVRRFAELNMTYQSSLSAMMRVARIFEITPAIHEPTRPIASTPTVGDVRFEDVSFRFSEESDENRVCLEDDGRAEPEVRAGAESPWVLRGVSLHAAPGERVAVVGLSGAGKTTLLSLLPRFYDASKGRVLIDGVDVRAYSLEGLRSSIAVVQQESFLFTGTIAENIAYGRPNASEAEIDEAAKAAHAHEFIARLPNGYRTRLGERGVNLSGGQRQRLSIARALLKDPRILILDEATSSLDSQSEKVVQQALERLMRGRTSFIIAHRLSTVENADRIVVLEDGKVAEVGRHAELIARRGVYHRLVGARG